MVDFRKDIIEASTRKPIVVDFWAEWCAPCRMLSPVLDKLASEANGKWQLVKINTEEQPQVAMQWRIQSIPAVKMFYNGDVIAEFIGALPETQVRRWLDENIPSQSKRTVEEAKQALSANDPKRAAKLLQAAIDEDKENFEARILLAELIFPEEPQKANELVKGTTEEHPLFEKATAIQTLNRLLSSSQDFSEAAKATPGDKEAWDLYLKGIDALRQHDYESAIKSWIETLMVNRNIDNDGPRKGCVALFTLLGQHHELTQKYHRAFTSALF